MRKQFTFSRSFGIVTSYKCAGSHKMKKNVKKQNKSSLLLKNLWAAV